MTTVSTNTTATPVAPLSALSVAPSGPSEGLRAAERPRSPAPTTSQRIVTTETIAAIQDLAFESGVSATGHSNEELARRAREEQAKPAAPEVQSYQELQAEARRWERYYAHQPRRLADLLAVYYGGQGGSVDPRGPHPVPLVDETSDPDTPAQ